MTGRARKAIIYFMILASMLFLTSCLNERPVQPRAEGGVIDLRSFPLQSSITRLDGEWVFYPHTLTTPSQNSDDKKTQKSVLVPGSWNNQLDQQGLFSGHGFGIYKLVIIVDQPLELGLKLPRVMTAYEMYVNGEKIASSGQTGESRNLSQPAYLPQTAYFMADQGENEMLVKVSNFHHRSGGLTQSIELGESAQIKRSRINAVAFDLFLFGSLFIIGIYHIAMYLFRRKYKPPLYFGLFCLLIALRTMFVGEHYFLNLFPGFSWELGHNIQTITYYLGMPIILLFLYHFFSGWFSRKITYLICLLSLPFILIVLLTPTRIFTLINPIFQIFSVITILYIVLTLLRILFKDPNKRDLPPVIFGSLFMILTSINDIIFFSVWLNDQPTSILRTIIRTGNLSSFGQIVFVLSFALVMARRISASFNNEAIAAAKLREINKRLDEIVAARTKELARATEEVSHQKEALEDVNKQLKALSLKDPLTGLWNRRQYDSTLKSEWDRAMRRQTPLSILVIDIDHFKSYNDNLGHAQGDKCLEKLADLIRESFQRSGELPARYGGEEFAVILPGVPPDQAYLEASRLCRNVEAKSIPHPESPISESVTVSIGVAGLIPRKDLQPENLFDMADQAMYQAKDNGRNQICLHKQSLS